MRWVDRDSKLPAWAFLLTLRSRSVAGQGTSLLVVGEVPDSNDPGGPFFPFSSVLCFSVSLFVWCLVPDHVYDLAACPVGQP